MMRHQWVAGGIGWTIVLGLVSSAVAQSSPPDTTWTTDASVEIHRSITDAGLGAVQGVVVREGKVYAYGDLVRAEPRVGVIREYTLNLEPTGRVVWLRQGPTPLITHPTGLTWHERWGTWLGDTVKTADPNRSRAVLYQIDWERAWQDGNLDRAVMAVIDDDAAVNGCRPEFVTLGGRALLATADYGDIRPEIRFYDPAALVAAGRSSRPGVVAHRVMCGSFNQNLHWDAATGHLTLVQNVVAGRGWRLDEIDLDRAIADGRTDGLAVRVHQRTFPSHDELEGYWPLTGERGLLAVARRRDNLVEATWRATEPRPSPPPPPTQPEAVGTTPPVAPW